MNKKQWFSFAVVFYIFAFSFMILSIGYFTTPTGEVGMLAGSIRSVVAGVFLALGIAFSLAGSFERG